MARSFSSAGYSTPDSSLLDTTAITVCAWCNTTGTQSQTIIQRDANGGSTTRQFALKLVSGLVQVVTFNSSGTASNRNSSGLPSPYGAWKHIAAVYTVNLVRMYVDGTGYTQTTSIAAPNSGASRRVDIGARSAGSQQYFAGTLAEVGYWGVGLTDNEILALANGVLPINIRPQSLKGYYPLHGINSVEADLSGLAMPMTLFSVGSTTVVDHAPVASPVGQ